MIAKSFVEALEEEVNTTHAEKDELLRINERLAAEHIKREKVLLAQMETLRKEKEHEVAESHVSDPHRLA